MADGQHSNGERERITLTLQPVLLDRRRMAAALCLSEDVLDSLRKLGMPSITVPGTSKVLFNPSRVVEWLERESHADEADESVSAKAARARLDAALAAV